MKRFEYQIISYPMDKKTSLIAMQDDLNARGREGWEVVSISSSEFAHLGHTAFLKRETAEGAGAK
ncbi:DUF4177 domain-containing protein [Ferrimonas balearica]|nr:DUF4177 domain-containing protein [Ferrimonas balearica]